MGWIEARERALELAEDLEPLGDVAVARFFSGASLRANGLQFAFVHDDVLYGRIDRITPEELDRLGLTPFRYRGARGEVTVGTYCAGPAEVFEGSDELQEWARRSLDAAIAAQETKDGRRRKSKID